jgi:cob(I)alamin adenosyltransferase
MNSFNKRGDKGTTSLMFGHRVPKNSPRPEAYGVIDEASSAMGLARGLIAEPELKRLILSIQEDLILVNAELACLPEDVSKLKARITDDHARKIGEFIEKYEALTEMPREFVPPGGTPASGALDLARSIIRRGERRIAGLVEEGAVVNPAMQSYCNRLADLLFTLARYVDSNNE